MMKDKSIYLYVVPFFPSPESWRGGFFLDAVKALVRDGRYDVRVMVAQAGPDYVFDGVRVFSFPRPMLGGSDYFPLLTDPLKKIFFLWKLRSMGVCPGDIAVCHVHLVERLAFYAAWLKRKNPKCLTLIHHHWSGLYGYPGGRMARFALVAMIEYLRLFRDYRTVDAHVFCSKSARRSFGRVFPGTVFANGGEARKQLPFGNLLPPMRYRDSVVCYNGCDEVQFAHRKEQAGRNDAYRIGCVANYIPAKSQLTLIKAVERVKDEIPALKLLLVGTGQCRESCQQYVFRHGLGDVVEFVAEMPHDKIADFYRTLDLYVLPSYFEAFNCSLIEALGCGVPVVTTNVISFKEVLSPEDHGRCLFAPKDDEELAAKILSFYRSGPNVRLPRLVKSLEINGVMADFLDWVDQKRRR